MFYQHSTTTIEPIFNIGTYDRRVSTIINISPAHCEQTPCMSVWTGQDWKSKFDGHVQPDRIKSKNSTLLPEGLKIIPSRLQRADLCF